MRKFYKFFFIAGIVSIISFCGCNIINPSEVVPTYVHIDSFSFAGNPNYGTSSHKITNVHVYFNNAPVGIFDLPVTFPVLATSAGTLLVLPGIDFAGLSGYEITYPFYDGDTMNLTPAPGVTLNFAPETRYSSSAKLPLFLENFDEPTTSFKKLSGDTTLGRVTGSEAFEGGGSGFINLSAGKDSVTIIQNQPIAIPINQESYLEINYKSNIPLQIGMNAVLSTGDSYSEYLIGLKDRSEWGKIYIGLRDFVSGHQGTEYRVLLRAQKFGGVTDAKVYIDNVKVISF